MHQKNLDMAKGLPYFKFMASDWLLNRISFQNYRVKGLFVDACAYYWHRDCTITTKELNQKLGKTNVSLLVDKQFIFEKNGKIIIKFLDEQHIELSDLHRKRSNAGKKGVQAKLKQSVSKDESTLKHLDTDKELDNKKKRGEDNELEKAYALILNFFSEDLRPKYNVKTGKWKKVVENLNKMGYSFDTIVKVVAWARAEKFWGQRFLSLEMLTREDKKNDMLFFQRWVHEMEASGSGGPKYYTHAEMLKQKKYEGRWADFFVCVDVGEEKPKWVLNEDFEKYELTRFQHKAG